jgi:antitoxin component YwqK of YwqJK toxin-antitoxin module
VTGWYENGQKEFEGTYKNGELDGFVTGWWSNGQKWYERTFKDGELISVKKWNEDGNLIEK